MCPKNHLTDFSSLKNKKKFIKVRLILDFEERFIKFIILPFMNIFKEINFTSIKNIDLVKVNIVFLRSF